MQPPRIRRSVLYVPASRPRAVERARLLPVDVVIFDLEDAVRPEEKEAARATACAAILAGGFMARELVVRINAAETEWAADDFAAVARAAPDAVLMPKISSAEDVLLAGKALSSAGAPAKVGLWAMVETPRAVADVLRIAEAARSEPRLSCLVAGLNDLAKDTRAAMTPGRAPMLSWLAAIVLAARVSDIDAIDGVYNAFRDVDGFSAECRQAREFGFDGKSLIHPDQVDVANAAFSPSAEELARAVAIINAFELPANRRSGAIVVDGQMVELLHLAMAHRIVALDSASTAAR